MRRSGSGTELCIVAVLLSETMMSPSLEFLGLLISWKAMKDRGERAGKRSDTETQKYFNTLCGGLAYLAEKRLSRLLPTYYSRLQIHGGWICQHMLINKAAHHFHALLETFQRYLAGCYWTRWFLILSSQAILMLWNQDLSHPLQHRLKCLHQLP